MTNGEETAFKGLFSKDFERLGLPKLAIKLPDIEAYLPKLPKFPRIDWEALHERDERAVRFAAQQNWFIQPESPYPLTADIDACNGNVDELHQLLTQSTTDLMPDIQHRLAKDYPARATIVEETFRLHSEKRYLAAIPLALLSAEGIALDVSNKSLFNVRSGGRPEIAGWLEKKNLSGLAKAILASLSEAHPMSKGGKNETRQLSRHRVLHGRDVNFGSELFSLQAISLLGFVGWTFAVDGLGLDEM